MSTIILVVIFLMGIIFILSKIFEFLGVIDHNDNKNYISATIAIIILLLILLLILKAFI